MKLLRFGPVGQERPALIDADGDMRDLSVHVSDIGGAALGHEGLARIRAIDPSTLPRVDPAVRIGPCITGVGKFICIGLNYADHAAESGMAVPSEPVVFMKATSAITGPNDQVEIPRGSTKTDWEVELGVIIGTTAKYVTEAQAADHIAGYCIVNDLSERAFQLEGTGQWVKGKSCDSFGPIGPWLVTPDEIPDCQMLAMKLAVNDRVFQKGSTSTMVYKVPFLVSYLSRFMTLHPGDIISTGTPPGVGMGQVPPLYLKPGDRMDLQIEGLGQQSQLVVAAA
jgi:2-keto-4-pentenoate hydratase/2-oxohepta-3-ene-1,7-dioic acid hydratase in catechol pathway